MDYKKAVKEKKEELAQLHTRMDNDRDLVNLSAYTLKDAKGNKIPHAVSITLNDPAVFAANVEAALGQASEQVAAETVDKNLDTDYIEDAVRAAFSAANNRLIKSGRWPLDPYFDQQTCRRGRVAARCLFRLDGKGELICDITYWDTRYVYHALDADGMLWGSYETKRSKDLILAEYPMAERKVRGKAGSVLDIWGRDTNEVYVEGEKVFDQENPYGYVPVCFQIVPLGSMLADEDNEKFQGESIFFLIRDLHPELNRLVSIIQSLNLKALDSALQWKSKEGTSAIPPDHDELTAPQGVTSADIGGGAESVPYGELKRSAYLLHQIIEARVQQGSLSKFELGAFSQPMSAVALIEVGQGRDQVFLPRLGARGLLKQQLAEMLISQITSLGVDTVEIGVKGHKKKIQVSKLEGAYDIVYKYFVKSPTLDIARYSEAAAAGDLIPDSAKRREILQREDPEEDERMLRWEEAERISPQVKMYRVIRSLREEAERGDKHAEFEADLLEAEMETMFGKVLAGEQQVPYQEKSQKPQQPLIPMFAQGKGAQPANLTPPEVGGE